MEAQDSDITMVEEPRGFKRPRSPSSDLSDEPLTLKVAKHSAESILGQAKRALSSSSDENLNDRASKRVKGSETDDSLSANNSIELGDATVYNLKLISVDEDGEESHLQPVTPTKSSNGQSILKDGLPTPQPTPMPKAGDPFDKASLPVPVGESVTAHDSPANFAYVGDMKLFGLFPSKVYFYQHVSDELHPYDEVVKISSAERLSLANLLPSLKGSDWDAIALEDPILGYQEEQLIGAGAIGRRRGLYFESDVVFQGALQPVSDFLRDFFHQDKPAIRLSTWLSEGRQYGKLEAPSSFVLRGSLQHMSLDLLDILKFREIGVELSGHQIYDTVARDTKWSFGYGFFGKLDLSVPCTAVPLQVEYYLRKSVNSWMLRVRLTDDEWNDVFGIKGLQLSEVLLQAKIDVGKEKDSRLSFGVEANLQLRKTTFGIRGYYSKDYYSVEAYLGDLSLQDVGEIFHELIGYELDIFSHDVVFKNMSLRLSSEGIQLLGAVTINGHTSARGALGLWRDGISISGGIGDLGFEHINIKEASFDVFIASKMDTACSRISKLDITGDVCFCGVELKVALHTETCPKEGDLMWTIYGEVQGDVTTSKLVPELEGTFLDISLNRLVLLASNHDMPAGSYKGINYPVAKGFQFCAGIDSIPELEHLMRGSVKGMVLRASYSSGQLGIGIILPAERTISFSNTVYSGPLEIEVQAGRNTALVLKALLNVKVDTQPDPLQFSLGLKADKVAASAYAQMLNDWTNPCNLGEKVVIRKCALEFGIVYTTFFTTGTPGVIGLAGELAIGSKLAGVAMKVSQNPSEQLLCAQIKDLGVVDLVQFASLVADHEFPTPDNFIHFNDVELYLSTGTTVGLTAYPPGASLKGDMTLFGKHAKFECTVGSKVKVMASIEPFSVGPLTVKGVSQPDPIVDIEISKDTQHVLIDGAVEVWGAMASLHLEAAFYPKTLLNFALALQLSVLFKLKLEAKLIGEVNIKDFKSWANADFEVYGLMEQHVIDHVVGQLEQQIDAAKEATKHGFDEVKKRMEEKEAAFKASCQEAIDELEVARADWHKKKANIDAAFNSAHEEAARIRRELQEKVDNAQRAFHGLIADKTAELERARADAAAVIWEAEHKVDEAQRDSDNSIHEAQSELHRVRQDFENGFGSAERDLSSARNDVENAQRRVDDLDRDIDWINRRIDDEPWYNCPPLIAEKAGLIAAQATATASLQVVRGIFYAAEGIVHGTGFVAAQGAIGGAELALEGIRVAKTEALNLAKDGLSEIRDAQDSLIQGAITVLREAETLSEELHVFDRAKDALQSGENMVQGTISGAQSAVDGLAQCGEFIAFDAAEKALQFAQQNTSELNLARHAVEAAEGTVNMGLSIAQWAIEHAGQVFNITKIEFSGSVGSLIHAEEGGPPLTATIEGTVFGERLNVHIIWKPDFDLVRFIKELFMLLWEEIKNFAKQMHL